MRRSRSPRITITTIIRPSASAWMQLTATVVARLALTSAYSRSARKPNTVITARASGKPRRPRATWSGMRARRQLGRLGDSSALPRPTT
jgi:hypothetical protein